MSSVVRTPGSLYNRDFLSLTAEEEKEKQDYLSSKSSVLTLKPLSSCCIAVRRNLSLFPNNYIELQDIKNTSDIVSLNSAFENLIHKQGTLEREVLNFINHTPAYHIIGSILSDRFPFGHHELYMFKEMALGNEYRTDYVLIGKGSGGYECVLIEMEKPDGRITLKDGHLGEAFRKGRYQVDDWQNWMDANFTIFSNSLKSIASCSLPDDLLKYNSYRFHYVVIAGLREDCNNITYQTARKEKRNGIYLLHHDNLLDSSKELVNRLTF